MKYNFNEHIKKELLPEYGGSDKKKTILLDDGNKYLLKFPDNARQNNLQVSYINNAISEYIGCKIFQSVGVPVQNVIMGEYITKEGKNKIACACQDLRQPGEQLYEVQNWEKSDLDSDPKKWASFSRLEDLAKLIEENTGIPFGEIISRYCDMYIIDALIGNTDRHNGNWGILAFDDHARISPVYDCGSSLSPLFDDSELSDNLMRREALNVLSATRDDDGNKINFRDYLTGNPNNMIKEALVRIVPKINIPEIGDMIHDIPYISDVRKRFYTGLIETRYADVLIPSLQKVLQEKLPVKNASNERLDLHRAKDDIMTPVDSVKLYGEGYFHAGNKDYHFRKVKSNEIMVCGEDKNPYAILSVRKNSRSIPDIISALNLQEFYKVKTLDEKIDEFKGKNQDIITNISSAKSKDDDAIR